jgi:ubiquinol-cytochrome c reductase cytochrome b subunit
MKKFIQWLDHRTGCQGLLHEALFEKVPGGSRWRYVWGSTLTFALVVQFITGTVLWMAYNPSAQTAWESVYYIQNEMAGGWFLRGIHHYMAQAMNVLLVLHLMQVVIDGAYRAPREINFWFGIILLLLVMGLSLTGYLLPWDQKGYWATKVATNIAGITPVIGPQLQKLIIGGADYGHHTLSRFFALHAGILPGAVVALLVGHIYLFRRHGITAKQPYKKPDEYFWPEQVLKDAVACLAVLAVVLFFVVKTRGAELSAPADPGESFSAARPEWYFLFLFEFLKYFPHGTEVWGAIVIPSIVLGVIFAMPLIGNWRLGHRFNLGFLWVMMVGVAYLTVIAMKKDRENAGYVAAVKEARINAERVQVLARHYGIPPTGAASLLRNDPLTQGPKLFAQHCASCHRFDGHDGTGKIPSDPVSAPDLKGIGKSDWIAGFMHPEKIVSSKYFGGTKFKDGKMVRFVKREFGKADEAQQKLLDATVKALVEEANVKFGTGGTADPEVANRRAALKATACLDCHQFHEKDEEATAPDLTGYASREWLISFISNPAHERFYGKRNDRMPAFTEQQVLDDKEVGLIVDWLREAWYLPPEQ